MGYCGPMDCGTVNHIGSQLELWDIRDYGLSEAWVMRGSTILSTLMAVPILDCTTSEQVLLLTPNK
jgi:hypothetical protein